MSKFITIFLLAGSSKVSSRWAWAVSPQSLWLQWSTAGSPSSWVGAVPSTLPGYLFIYFYRYGDVRLCCDWRTEAWFTGITQPSGTAGAACMRRSVSFLHLNILMAKKLTGKFCAEALNSFLWCNLKMAAAFLISSLWMQFRSLLSFTPGEGWGWKDWNEWDAADETLGMISFG